MQIKPIKKSKDALTEIFITPVEGYVPNGDDTFGGLFGRGGVPMGQMADLTARDRGNFSDWVKKYGGFHLDERLKKFVHD